MLKKLFKKSEKNVVKKTTKIETLKQKEINKIIGGTGKDGLERAQDDLQRTGSGY
jgi:hypothetical protein